MNPPKKRRLWTNKNQNVEISARFATIFVSIKSAPILAIWRHVLLNTGKDMKTQFHIICGKTFFFNFDQNFDFWEKFRSLTKISMFDKNFDLWRSFLFSTKISIFDQNYHFWRKFFRPKLRLLSKNSILLFFCLNCAANNFKL